MTVEVLKFQLFLRGVDVDDPENELETKKKEKEEEKLLNNII